MLCKRSLCRHAVSVRPSVRLSVTFVDSVETKKHRIFTIFSPSGSHTILVFFRTKRLGNILTGTSLTGASNAGGVGKNRDFRRIAGYRSMTAAVRSTTATVDGAVYRTEGHASVNLCLSQSTWSTTTNRNRTEQNLIVRSRKSNVM